MSLAAYRTALLTLLSHYRRHPGQLVMLLVGLWVASALWSGVQAINASARDSYARAEALFSQQLDRIERRDGQPLRYEDFLTLRRDGAPVSPMVEGEVELADGTRLPVLGIDPLTLPEGGGLGAAQASETLLRFLRPPYRTRVAPETLATLSAEPGATPTLASGGTMPPLATDRTLPPELAVMDIAAAVVLLEASGPSHLVIAPEATLSLPDEWIRHSADNLTAPGQLTDSFHLNLTAMGLLALVVGLFIVHAALSLTLEQRLGLMRTLRALGLPGRPLVALLATELLILGLVGAMAGIASGVWLAQWLLPDVAASLQALYGERLGDELSLPWYYWAGGLTVTLGGLLTAGASSLWHAARLDILAMGRSQAWHGRFQRQLTGMAVAGGLLWLLAIGLGGWLHQLPPRAGLTLGFTMIAAALLGSALWLPPLLASLLAVLARTLRHRPLAQWAFADVNLQLPRLSVAMMALLIALSANLGVSSMVDGFRLTFLDWLDQRLVADLYLRPPADRYEAVADWLRERDGIDALLPTRDSETRLIDTPMQSTAQPVGLYGVTPHPRLRERWPLLDAISNDPWPAFQQGAVMINEQLALSSALSPGETLTLRTPQGPRAFQVAAVYADYGNPRGEVMLTTERLIERFQAPPGSIGLVLPPGRATDISALRDELSQHFGISRDSLIDQATLKQQSRTIFERTFAITRALNGLTLGVAGIALLTSLLAQAPQRRRQLAPLWAQGVSRRRLTGIGLCQLGGTALITACLAVPLGLALAWSLVAKINVAAFGWRLPLHVFPEHIATTLVLAVAVTLLAALLPAWRLWRLPPGHLLREFDAS
ncbi:FtsX-like permease family protein [Aidingimonas lacisalsi]|uniref:FtsX-like permease family protein n=1 Tax=Aidingimonas lacisalsi TaxID=2604086 RepID=UPI001F262F97|nr:ABC transporter permease [Aidingimonas lacisalsi]